MSSQERSIPDMQESNWVRGGDGMWKEVNDHGGWVMNEGEWKWVPGGGEWTYDKTGKMTWIPDAKN
jgi:hypothetical protein